uniref:Histidinol-phosphate aminotransferase n=1 Tax=Candidatus Kentrum sp. FW TaxID=2126338 RepID=A0A450SSP3_9GAMM|nr:MAG: histidinol-phosphate aminotransferase [Candidatus Kentron sp. FW]VFJ57053.1 MAG: histidinol-phosphate aminotransferase [Candidatus Kentron sp. FW]
MTCDLLSLAPDNIRSLQPYRPGKPIEELERELGIPDIVKLASNENPSGPGPMAREAVARYIGELGRYPDGNGFLLKQKIAAHLSITPEMLTLGNGSNDVLELVARVFASREHQILFSEHAFAVYPLAAQAVGARGVTVPAIDFGHDLSAMLAAVTDRTRVIFIANPNNPTGTWVDTSTLDAFLQAVPDTVLVVVDEAYGEYVDNPDYPDCVAWLPRYSNLIVTRTFSKAHGLAGLRVGYAISHPDIADLLNRIRQPFNVNSMALAAATAALEDTDHLRQSKHLNDAGYRQLTTAFDKLGLEYIPSVGNFITVHVGRSGEEVYNKLLKQGVIVRPIGNYALPHHLRVTIGLEPENAKFIRALEHSLETSSA